MSEAYRAGVEPSFPSAAEPPHRAHVVDRRREGRTNEVMLVEHATQSLDELHQQQTIIAEAVHDKDALDPIHLAIFLEKRNQVRREAIQQVDRLIACLGTSSLERGGQLEDIIERANVVREGQALDLVQELEDLKQRKEAANEAKIALMKGDFDVKEARLRRRSDDMSRLQEICRRLRRQSRDEERAYAKTFARLTRIAKDHAPELLPQIVKEMSESVQAELEKLTQDRQLEVLGVLSEKREVAHYDEELGEMPRLSKESARHKVLEAKYEGEGCVLKTFDLGDDRGLSGFFAEIALYLKLRHARIVPLRCAFFDDQHGFFHFDRYPCDLREWMRRPANRRPLRTGEPAAAAGDSLESGTVALAMAESVAFVHVCGVVHGDLKPANWLWDDELGPLLGDFETARNQGPDGCASTMVASGPQLHTREYAAPELADPTHPKTRQSDVFALGRSIEELLRHLLCGLEDRQLSDIARAMVCPTPNERISAAEVERRCLALCRSDPAGEDGAVRRESCMNVRLFYTQSSMAGQFRDGQSLEALIDAVVRDPEYPLKDGRLVIEVVKKGRALMSLDNRRLQCFRVAQERLGSLELFIHVRERQWLPWMDRYYNNLDARNRGRDIHIRSVRR